MQFYEVPTCQKYHKLRTYPSATEHPSERISEADKMLKHPGLKYDTFPCPKHPIIKIIKKVEGICTKRNV